MFENSILLLSLFWIIRISNGNTQSYSSRGLSASQFGNATYMDMLSRKAMEKMHDELDKDDDGNVSISEGVKFVAGHKDLVKNPGANANLPGFVTDVDGRITEAEFWDSWIKSHVHNWTNGEMLSWLQYDAEMPQYANNFQTLNITGAAFPILACDGSIVSTLVDGSKENKLKLMLKAKEIVLFGPSKPKSNWLKDALLTFSFALALSGIAFGVHVQRNANRTILSIQEKMKLLQSTMDKMEEEAELDWPRDVSRQDDERSAGSNSGDSEDSMNTSFSLNNDDHAVQGKLAEVMRELDATKEALRIAEKKLQKKLNSSEIPPELLSCLQMTYQKETMLFEMKKKQVYKNVDQTKAQFQKIEKNRSSFFGVLQVVHSRQVDSFDYQVQQTRDEFQKLQGIVKERRRRWALMEQICGCRIMPSSVRRSSATPSRLTARSSTEEELLSNILDMSPSSSLSSLDQGSGKGKANKQKRYSSPCGLGSDDYQSNSTRDVSKSGIKKVTSSPVSHKPPTMPPSHASSPSLSTANGHGYRHDNGKKSSNLKLTHSESAKVLTSHPVLLSIPETANQTFPRRSPQAKRRDPLPNSFVTGSLQENGKDAIQSSHAITVQKAATDDESSDKPILLDPSKRSSSAHSLPQLKDGQISPVTDALQQRAAHIIASSTSLENDGTNHTTDDTTPDIPSLSLLDTSRKSNLKKRSFFNILQRKKKVKSSE